VAQWRAKARQRIDPAAPLRSIFSDIAGVERPVQIEEPIIFADPGQLDRTAATLLTISP